MKSKHKESIIVEQTVEDFIEILECDSVELQTLKCEECEFVAIRQSDIDNHVAEKHNAVESPETNEIKLEVFILVEYDLDVFEARKALIDRLSDQKEVEKVEKVYVDKNESFTDIHNLKWNTVDILLRSKATVKSWKDLNFRKNIFSKCFLWDSCEDERGAFTRENLVFRRQQTRMGYQA